MSSQDNHPFSGRTFYNFDDNLEEPRHRWFHFKEGFSHRLVTEAIDQLAAENRILTIVDPFGGSGTTALTAALLGHNVISMEVNPFCSFAARVKCSRGIWRTRQFRRAIVAIVQHGRASTQTSPHESFSTFSEKPGATKWLFNRAVLRACAGSLGALKKIPLSYREPLRLGIVRAAMRCCNAKKDGKCLRYYTDWKERAYTADDFLNAFEQSANEMLMDAGTHPIGRECSIRISCGDSRRLLTRCDDECADLIVTSPPYLNSLDYSDVYRPELFLGGFVSTNKDVRQIRLQTIRSHVQVKWGGPTNIKNQKVRSVVEDLLDFGDALWNPRLPNMIEAYFHDLKNVLEQVFRLLKRGAEAWLVVSTSAYKALQIPVDLILADIGCEAGLTLKGVYVLRNLRSSSQQWKEFGGNTPPLRESLIIFRKA
jgi:DNA modification methylase